MKTLQSYSWLGVAVYSGVHALAVWLYYIVTPEGEPWFDGYRAAMLLLPALITLAQLLAAISRSMRSSRFERFPIPSLEGLAGLAVGYWACLWNMGDEVAMLPTVSFIVWLAVVLLGTKKQSKDGSVADASALLEDHEVEVTSGPGRLKTN